ncbi:MAG: HAMP domain-containing protein, partial [Spirochaetales bacterium]
GGSAWLSLASYGADGIRRLDRFAGPFPYRGAEAPILFSAASGGSDTFAVAVSTDERAIAIYISRDGGLSFDSPYPISTDEPVVAPRIFPSATGGWHLFATRGDSDSLSIRYAGSPDGSSWSAFSPFVDSASGLRLNFLPSAERTADRDIVVFQSLAGGSRPSFQLFSRITMDGGLSWSEPRRVTNFLDPIHRERQSADDFDNQRPHVAIVGGDIWLTWERRVLSGPAQIYAARLDPTGSVITGSVERVSLGQGNCAEPRMVDAAEEPAIIWFDDRTGANRVFLSLKEGFLWRERDLSVRSRGDATFGRAVYANGSLWAFWQRGKGTSSAVMGLSPDVTVKPPALSAMDFQPDVPTRRDKASLRWVVPSDSSGISGFSYLWTRDPTATPPLTVMVLETETRTSQTATEDGQWYFSIRAQDYAGNWSDPTRISFIRDTTPPGMPVPGVPPVGPNGFLSSNSFRLDWSPPPETDVAGYTWILEYLGPLDRPPARRLPAVAPTAPTDDQAGQDAQEITYSFGPATDYESRVWDKRPPAIPAPSIRTVAPRADFSNIDDGYWSFSVAAVDATGNVGDAVSIILRTDKFIPYTLVSDVLSDRDDFGILRLRILGRGFLEDGPITHFVIDADGREPYDRDFRLKDGDFSIRSDRLLEGTEAEDLPAGSYRVGLYHPLRGWYFTGPRLSVDISGTVKFGDFGLAWKPDWVFSPAGTSLVNIGTLFMILALLFPLVGVILSLRQVAAVVREGKDVRLEAIALLEGKPMPALERERAVKAALRKGTGLTAKFALTISLLVMFVVGLVSVPLGIQMMRSQSEILARGLGQRVRVLLESAAQGGRSYLPVRNQLELATLPGQMTALEEAIYLTVTGYGTARRTDPDVMWATNDPDILDKIDGSALVLGESSLRDALTPRLAAIAAAIDEKAAAEVGTIAEELQRLQDESMTLATKLDAASQERLTELSASSAGLQRELTRRLAVIADGAISSEPAFDPTALSTEPGNFIFYKPILYRQPREPIYFRGMVRIEVSTELIVAEVLRSRDILLRNMAIVAAIALAAGIIGAITLAGIIITPIRKLVKGIEHIRDTPDKKELSDFSIAIKSRDEIGTLADTINDMTMGLVVAAKEAEFLTVGKEVQKMFIPLETNALGEKLTTGYEDTPTHSFYGYYEGAKGVSGDYFDYRKLDDRYWAFIKCDVSGKGIPAALIMVGVATIFASEFQGWSFKKNGIKLDALTYKINDFLFRRGFKGRFAALLLGVYDSQTGAVYICHAGDKFLYVYSSSQRDLIKYELVDSPAAGPIDNEMVELSRSPFTQVVKRIEPQDALVLYTDGFEESNRARRGPDFTELFEIEKSRNSDGSESEHKKMLVEYLGEERIKEATKTIMTGGRFRLVKEDDPMGPGATYDFDFSSFSGKPEELVLGLAAIEKVFRMVPDPAASDEDMVLVDTKVDAMLERCFLQYGTFCRDKVPHEDPRRKEYIYYRRLKEDDQYDDLTMLVIRRNA